MPIKENILFPPAIDLTQCHEEYRTPYHSKLTEDPVMHKTVTVHAGVFWWNKIQTVLERAEYEFEKQFI